MGYQITVFILRWHTVMPTTETATHSTVPLKMNRKRTPVNTLVMLRVRGMVNIIIVFKRAHTIRFSCFSRRSLFRRRSHTFRRAATPGIYIGPALFECRMSVCVRQRVFVCVKSVVGSRHPTTHRWLIRTHTLTSSHTHAHTDTVTQLNPDAYKHTLTTNLVLAESIASTF